MAQNELNLVTQEVWDAAAKADWPKRKDQVEQVRALLCQKLGQPLDLDELAALEQKLETLLHEQKRAAEEFDDGLCRIGSLDRKLGEAGEKTKRLGRELDKQRCLLLEGPGSLRELLKKLYDLSCGCGPGFRPQLPRQEEERILENLTEYINLLAEYAELSSALECHLEQMKQWLRELETLKPDRVRPTELK